jgi:hypothetical protein
VSAPSNEVVVTVAGGNCSQTLYAPFQWHTSGRGSAVTLTWDASPIGCPPTEFIIEAGSVRGASDVANFRTGSAATRYDAINVRAGTYYVRLRSVNSLGVSFPSTERILVFDSGPCVHSVGPSTAFISSGGLPAVISVQADQGCAWTLTSGDSWLFNALGSVLPFSGSGDNSVRLYAGIISGPIRTGTAMVRWLGGGADVPVCQNSVSDRTCPQ